MSQEQELVPIEQQTLLFYGKPIIVVRLPDARPAVVLRFLCENLQIDTAAQVARIRRTEAIADDMVSVQVQTDGGPQSMMALILRAVPFWLAGIDPKRVREEIRPDIIRYQREVVDVLYTWAQSVKAAPSALVPSEQITRPVPPANDASLTEWREYHRQMVTWIDWQADIEQWRASVESRLEGVEAMTGLIPEILERLGPQTITPEHHHRVQALAKQLHQATGKPFPTIYDELKTLFEKPRIEDLLEDDWPQIENWFKVQLERAKKKK